MGDHCIVDLCADQYFLELIAKDPTSIPPGQWEGVTIREGANDRNVRSTVENEGGGVGQGRANDNPAQAQFLGELAPTVAAGSENRTIGFRVQGVLDSRTDVDTYSFKAQSGSEVWFDIDRSYSSLDSVVELVDIAGNVLARSDTSTNEEDQPSSIFVSAGLDEANPLRKSSAEVTPRSAFNTAQDLFSTNPKDAGLRIVLPGDSGAVQTYHVRVRSANSLTRGAYELNLRVRETDESIGTVIQLADIRYATSGINVIGQPLHSILVGEEAEQTAANDTRAQAQPIGALGVAQDAANNAFGNAGPLNSDRGATSIAGSLSGATDVDWYQFDIQYKNLTRESLQSNLRYYMSTIFDVDYADGFARPDISLWIFDANGNLVLSGLDSNVGDDQPSTKVNSDTTDVDRGSAGNLDPYVGSVELPEGRYFMALSGRDFVPAEFNQFFVANPANPLFRLEPVESIRRVVEDRIGGPTSGALAPQQSVLFDTSNMSTPYTINDVALYVNNGGTLNLINPFTGISYGSVSTLPNGVIGFNNADIRDIAFRYNGDLQAYLDSGNPADGDDRMQYALINSGTGALTNLTPNGTNLSTWHDDIGIADLLNILETPSQAGFIVEGMAFTTIPTPAGGVVERGFSVGNRPDNRVGPLVGGLDYDDNVLLEFNPVTGNLLGPNVVPISEFAAGAGIGQREKGGLSLAAWQMLRDVV